jgi:tetratricopeptide (TPR) repeat protein
VHKFAGQLLFENGAFEDALVAFSHQPIAPLLENYDIVLTQGKSLFLLGKFKEAYAVIRQAQDLKYSEEVELDLRVIDILDTIAHKSKYFP